MKFEKVKGSANHHLFRPIKADGQVSNVFWVRVYKAAKGRLEESLKTEILSDARIIRDKRVAEWLGQKPRNSSKVFLVEEKFPEFLELKKIKSKGTYASMETQWRVHLQPFFGGMILDEVTETTWLQFVAESRTKAPNRKFFNDRKYLGMFLGWCHRDGLITKLPRLEKVDPERKKGKVYPDEEIAMIVGTATGDLLDQVALAFTMGMRHGEIWSLEWDQVDFRKNLIHLPAEKTKIRKARTFAMSPDGRKALEERKASASDSSWVFPHPQNPDRPHGKDGIKTQWKALRKHTGIVGTFHHIRHTFLTHAFKSPSVNPALVCEYAGVSMEEAQKTYLHFTVEDTRAVAEIVKL